jgi:hypothetical protein
MHRGDLNLVSGERKRQTTLMDADEVAEAFLSLHQSGKVRHFGVSNFTPAQFARPPPRHDQAIGRMRSCCSWSSVPSSSSG